MDPSVRSRPPQSVSSPWQRSIAFYVMACVSWLVVIGSWMRYGTFDASEFFAEQRDVYLRHPFTLYAHVMSSGAALIAGPLQLHRRLRERLPYVHRIFGVLYLIAVLCGALTGLALATWAYGGWPARLGFATLAMLWLTTGTIALYQVRQRNIQAHLAWSVRNFALAFAAVTLRVWTPLLDMVPGVDFEMAYGLAAWLSWIPNLWAAELLYPLIAAKQLHPASMPRTRHSEQR